MCNFLFFQPPFFFRILFGPELNVGRYSGGPRFDGGIRGRGWGSFPGSTGSASGPLNNGAIPGFLQFASGFTD